MESTSGVARAGFKQPDTLRRSRKGDFATTSRSFRPIFLSVSLSFSPDFRLFEFQPARQLPRVVARFNQTKASPRAHRFVWRCADASYSAPLSPLSPQLFARVFVLCKRWLAFCRAARSRIVDWKRKLCSV